MKEKILKYTGTENVAQIIEKICFFVIGFVMSFAKIAGIFSPFCIAFSMSLQKKWSIFSFLGGIFGVIVCFNNFNSEVYICALTINGFGTMDNKGITKRQFWIQMSSAGFNLLLGIYWIIWGILMACGCGCAGIFAIIRFIRNK